MLILVAGEDYSPLNNSEVMYSSENMQCWNVTLVDDCDLEETETFIVSISSRDSIVYILEDTATIFIMDNESKGFE